jgi:hypothetical protein
LGEIRVRESPSTMAWRRTPQARPKALVHVWGDPACCDRVSG